MWDGRIRADARSLPLADACVQCVVTSPPYFGLRDYGNAQQLGMEETPEQYVESLRVVFAEVWRVLKPDGVLWLNLGDSYAGSWGAQGRQGHSDMTSTSVVSARQIAHAQRKQSKTGSTAHLEGIKAKDLYGIPWMVAFALRADGWYLRSDIIWHKPNPMPESVTDRCTKAHEYIFMLTKSDRYYYNADAIAETCAYPDGPNSPQSIASPHGQGFTRNADSWKGSSFNDGKTGFNGQGRNQSESSRKAKTWEERKSGGEPMRQGTAGPKASGVTSVFTGRPTRNKRSVWTVSTSPYPDAHYATFPEEIPDTCIRAGSMPGDLILDPFFGSGTVGRVAERLGRRWVGIDLGYQDLQEKRLRNVQREIVGL